MRRNPTESPEQLSVEQLAVNAGLPTTTVRMYQSKGLLHPPRRVGRTARYDSSHAERLTLIQRLQARGFSLPAIAELIKAWEGGQTVAGVLGLANATGPDDWIPVTAREMRAMVSIRDLRPRLLRRASELGLLRWRRNRPHIRRWALESGSRVTTFGVPPAEVLEQFAEVRSATDAIVTRFVELFERLLWPQLAEQTGRDDQLEQVRTLLMQLTDTAESVVLGALRESVREAAEQFARRHDLLPSDGALPAWADNPVPVLGDELTAAADAPDQSTIQRFIAEVAEPPADGDQS